MRYFGDPKVFPEKRWLMGVYTFDFGAAAPPAWPSQPEALWQISRAQQGPAELMEHEPYLCAQPEGSVHLGYEAHRGFFVRALFFSKTDISSQVLDIMEKAPCVHCYLHFQHMGGVVSRTKTPFLAREAEWSLVISGVWHEPSLEKACKEWVLEAVRQLLPQALGSYATDLGPEDTELARHSFGQKATEELLRLKKRWDPQNLFRCGFPLAALEA